MYLGYVVEKRGRDERIGRHPPILTESEYQRTITAIRSRTRAGNKPRPFGYYLLRGPVYCECGTRMRGEAHVQRGTDRRYYRCPRPGCPARRCPADLIEPIILGQIATAVLPDLVIDTARAELRRLLQDPDAVLTGRQRRRLERRLKNLKLQHEWGDISDEEYRTKRDETRSILDGLPDGDRIRLFDAHRATVVGLATAVDAATPSQHEELCHIVIDRVVVRDREIDAVQWAHPYRVFLERQRECPQGDSNP